MSGRADAMADAATLRALSPESSDVEEAYRMGGWVVAHLAGGNEQAAVNAACLAARGAFRAVPVLRDACPCASHPEGHRFYTSARKDSGRLGARHVALSGPYATHGEALEHVREDRDWAHSIGDPKAPWYSYGTFSVGPETPIKVARS